MTAQKLIDRVEALEATTGHARRGGVVEVPGGPFGSESEYDAACAQAVAAAEAAGRIGPYLVVPAPISEVAWERAAASRRANAADAIERGRAARAAALEEKQQRKAAA